MKSDVVRARDDNALPVTIMHRVARTRPGGFWMGGNTTHLLSPRLPTERRARPIRAVSA